jgi:hypothetical protein
VLDRRWVPWLYVVTLLAGCPRMTVVSLDGVDGGGDAGEDAGSPDGSLPDGSLPDGSLPDGSLPDGSLPDGSLPDGSLPDGSLPDGSLPDGSLPDGSLPDGSFPDGSLPDGSLPDAGPPGDSDGDGIPDEYDPFPMDPDFPGVVSPDFVYANTSGALFTLNPATREVVRVGPFVSESGISVSDIAINRYGVLFATTSGSLFACRPDTARCRFVGAIWGGGFIGFGAMRGLTFLPPGSFGKPKEILAGFPEYSGPGTWHEVVLGGAPSPELGDLGADTVRAGDGVYVDGMGLFAATVRRDLGNGNVIVECDPGTGAITRDVVIAVGYTDIAGLAGTRTKLYAFNGGGQILEVDPKTDTYEEIAATAYTWRGAASSSGPLK